MTEQHSTRDLDWPLLIITLTLAAIGVLQVYSATHDTAFRDAWWKQILYISVGLGAFAVVSYVHYHSLLDRAPILYGVAIVLLLVTLAVGRKVFGSTRWIPLAGGFHLQVSEFAKFVLILIVARYLTELKAERLHSRDLLKLCGLVVVPMALVLKQPDLGTALTYVPILVIGLFLAGPRWQHYMALILAAGLVVPVGWRFLKDYQKERIYTFLEPARDPRGAGYQVIQSQIAVGQGGMWGKGVTQGSQTQLQFLPVPHTDFIFSTYAEEHGFVGVLVALGLYFLLLMQIVQNAQTAPDRAGMHICMGVAALLLFHLLVNAGMVVGRMPVTGIPLPLMSAGGSSTLSMFMMLGLVNSVRFRRFVN